MKDKKFEDSWIKHYDHLGNKRNRIVALIALIAGTVLILPDVLLNDSYSQSLLIIRILASFIGFTGYVLFRFKKLNNRTMVLFYALPVFSVSAYMVALESNITTVTQLNNTLAVVGIFFIAMFLLKVSSWIIICSVLLLSYFGFIITIGTLPLSEYLLHGGSLVIIGFLTFPFVVKVRYRMLKENFKLTYEIKQQKEELEYYANNDLLTDSFNRRGGMKILEQSISMSRRHDLPLSISFIDINGLKMVNDKFGHASGDILLQTIAKLIKENIRKSDSLFRFGGDEFIIIFPGCSIKENKKVMNKIRKASNDFESNDTKDFEVNFSYGLAEYKENMSIDDFIKTADKEMYNDKK